jgi:type II secretory pathway predicted ATPase ExeA
MYEKSFGLKARPFLAAPREDRCHSNRLMDCARQTLTRTIDRGEGPGLLIGPPGTGKTLLCQRLAHDFADRVTPVQLAGGRLGTRTALLQAILYELGLPYRGMDEGELRLALIDFLEPREDGLGGVLLLVDEAQVLPLRVLEEIRLITNLVRDGQPRVRVVLAGTPELEERFASPKLNTFAQRLAARCYLDALDFQETTSYVRAELAAVGGDPSRLLNEETLRSIYRASDGIPRLINQVCDHALMLCSLGGHTSLSSDAIEEAWADLQQLPTPWSSGSREGGIQAGVIEFGSLDAADDTPEAIPFRSEPQQPLHLATPEESLESDPMRVGKTVNAFSLTEVDLDFPEFGDPNGEEFEEEEVVLDRYPNDSDLFAGAPRVSSWESRQLASILGAFPAPQPITTPVSEATLSFVTGVRTPSLETPTVQAVISNVIGEACAAKTADDAVIQEPTLAETFGASALDSIDSLETAISREAMFWAGAKTAAGDAQLIVLEDDAPSARRPAARRSAYRQLFSKLRRG